MSAPVYVKKLLIFCFFCNFNIFKFFKLFVKELIEGGARMHLNLPIDVLQERCRIYMEVKNFFYLLKYYKGKNASALYSIRLF